MCGCRSAELIQGADAREDLEGRGIRRAGGQRAVREQRVGAVEHRGQRPQRLPRGALVGADHARVVARHRHGGAGRDVGHRHPRLLGQPAAQVRCRESAPSGGSGGGRSGARARPTPRPPRRGHARRGPRDTAAARARASPAPGRSPASPGRAGRRASGPGPCRRGSRRDAGGSAGSPGSTSTVSNGTPLSSSMAFAAIPGWDIGNQYSLRVRRGLTRRR